MLLSNHLFLLSLHLSLLNFFLLYFFLLFFMLLSLNDSNALVKFSQEMTQLGVYFVGEVAKVNSCFVIDGFEEHD